MISLRPYSKKYYIDKSKRLKILTLPCLSDNYTFLILSPDKKEAFLVDCSDHKKVLQTLGDLGLSLKGILLTHHHFDHVDGLDVILKEHPTAEFYFTKTDQDRRVFESRGRWVNEADNIDVFGEKVKVFFTPGHTTSHVSYYLPKSDALFCGDLIFSLGCGRVFEPYDNVYEDFFESLQKIKSLTSNETLIFCAHEYTKKNLEFHASLGINLEQTLKELKERCESLNSERSIPTTMGFEKKHNAFLSAKSPDSFKNARKLKDQF